MTVQLNPYISFSDNAREAMEFYHSIFGGSLDIRTFKEYHASSDPAEDNKVMHAVLKSNNLTFMAADTPSRMSFDSGKNISMSLSGDDADSLRRYWSKLAEGGMVVMPLEPSPWGDVFGMLTDKFGINWMVDIVVPKI